MRAHGIQRHRLGAVVAHPLLHARTCSCRRCRRSISKVWPCAVVPGQRRRLARRRPSPDAAPQRVVVGHLDARAGPGRPAELDVIGLGVRARLQHAHQRANLVDGLAVVAQHHVIEPGAEQADAAGHARRVDLDARHLLRHQPAPPPRLAGRRHLRPRRRRPAARRPAAGACSAAGGCGTGRGAAARKNWKTSRIAIEAAIAMNRRVWSIKVPSGGPSVWPRGPVALGPGRAARGRSRPASRDCSAGCAARSAGCRAPRRAGRSASSA